jgi:Domain of unknown function (DUF4404)
MERKHLEATLDQLRTDLSLAERIDPETRASLRAVANDIERLLDEQEQAPRDDVEPVSNSLRDLMLKFEADYPQLSASVGRVADALAAMGF